MQGDNQIANAKESPIGLHSMSIREKTIFGKENEKTYDLAFFQQQRIC